MPVSGVNEFHPPGPLHIFLHGPATCTTREYTRRAESTRQAAHVKGTVDKINKVMFLEVLNVYLNKEYHKHLVDNNMNLPKNDRFKMLTVPLSF